MPAITGLKRFTRIPGPLCFPALGLIFGAAGNSGFPVQETDCDIKLTGRSPRQGTAAVELAKRTNQNVLSFQELETSNVTCVDSKGEPVGLEVVVLMKPET